MMNNFAILLSIFSVFALVSCRPSPLTPDVFGRDATVELPGRERITKRSAIDYIKTLAVLPLNTPNDSDKLYSDSSLGELKAVESNEDYIEAPDKNAFHPLPVFRKRSINDNNDEQMEVGENGLVFLPLFRPGNGFVQKQRFQRSVEDSSKTKFEAGAEDDLEGAETIIFRPVFRSQLRPVRSILNDKSLKGSDVDNMDVAENGLIFRPIFRTRQGNNY